MRGISQGVRSFKEIQGTTQDVSIIFYDVRETSERFQAIPKTFEEKSSDNFLGRSRNFPDRVAVEKSYCNENNRYNVWSVHSFKKCIDSN